MAAKKKASARKATMSDAEQFCALLDKNKDLQDELKGEFRDIVHLGRSHGFKFTLPELLACLNKKYGVTKPPTHYDPDTCTG